MNEEKEKSNNTSANLASILRDSQNTSAIMRELSDLKSNLAINSTETTNIKNTINEIKNDVKEIKNDFISRREFNESVVNINDQINPMKKVMYGLMGTVGLAVLGSLLRLVLIK